jgi:formiminotetrahydrofolate cyclodeaminase
MITGGRMKLQRLAVPLSGALLLMVCSLHAAALARQSKSLDDRAYRKSVLQKIGNLIESKYVLAEKAKKYAAEFNKMVKAGSYASITDAKEFADKVTADLQTITHDPHVSLRKIEASDIGEKAVSALHHPVRFHRLGIKENKQGT